MEEKILKADPNTKRNIILFVIGMIVAGGLSLLYVQGFLTNLEALAKEDSKGALEKGIQMIRTILIVNAFVISLFGLYALRISIRAYLAGQYPPPGTKVIRNMKIITGKKAIIRAWVGGLMALLLIGSAIYSLQLIPRMEERLKSGMFEEKETQSPSDIQQGVTPI